MGAACFCPSSYSPPDGATELQVNNNRYYRSELQTTFPPQQKCVVYEIRDRRGRQYTLKDYIQSELQIAACRKEKYCHELLAKTKQVIRLTDCEINESEPLVRFVFPFYHQGTVQEYIEKIRSSSVSVSENLIMAWAYDLCRALEALHSLEPTLAHRSIKPDKLYLTDNLQRVVLSDLSSVIEVRKRIENESEAQEMQQDCRSICPIGFIAPELYEIRVEHQITEKCDIWSLGCTIHAMAFGASPVNEDTLARNWDVDFTLAHNHSQEYAAFFQWLLRKRADERPSAEDIRICIKKTSSIRRLEEGELH